MVTFKQNASNPSENINTEQGRSFWQLQELFINTGTRITFTKGHNQLGGFKTLTVLIADKWQKEIGAQSSSKAQEE